MELEVIKKKFNEIRRQKGLSWADLTAKAGVNSYQSIYNHFNGTGLTLGTLEKLANLLGVQPWELLKPDTPQEESTQAKPQAPALTCPHCGKPIYFEIQAEPQKRSIQAEQDTKPEQELRNERATLF